MKEIFSCFSLSSIRKFLSTLALLLSLGIGSVFGTDLTTNDLDFGTPAITETFEDVTAVQTRGNTSTVTDVTTYTTYGVFTSGYIGKAASIGYDVSAAESPMTSKFLKVIATTKGAGMCFSSTFATKGAFSFTIAKSSVIYIGFYNNTSLKSGTNIDAYTKAKCSAYLYFTGSAIQINSGSAWVDVVTDMTDLPDAFDVTVVYNNTSTDATYNNGNTALAAKRAHVFINGSAIMNGSSPKAFTIPGADLAAFRIISNITSSASTTKIDDIKIYDALPSAAATCADPSSPGKDDVAGTSATITVGTSGDYNIYYSTSSSAPSKSTAGTTTISSSTSVGLTSLAYGTTYYYWAQKDCGSGSKSNYVAGSPTSFTTTVPDPTGLSATPSLYGASFTITDANDVGSYDIYCAEGSTAPDGNTTPTASGTSKSISVTGLKAGTTYYYWARAKGPNANSSWYGGSTFATLTLSGISVATAPTTTKYLVGDNFDPTGLVITRTYSNSTSDSYTYANHTSEFSFSPATNTALTAEDDAVTITYGGQTVDQSINVYSVTVNKVNMSGTAISADGVSATCSGRTLSQSVGSTNYVFNSWNVTAGGVTVSTNSITGTPSGNVTIAAKFHDPLNVTWKVNNSSVETTEVKFNTQVGSLPTAPEDNTLNNCANTFMGWSDKNAGSTPKPKSYYSDLFTTKAESPTITQDTTFYAVFAEVKTGRFEINTTNSGVDGSYNDLTFTVGDIQFKTTQWLKSTNIQAKASQTKSLYNNSGYPIPGTITSIKVKQTGTSRAVEVYGHNYYDESAATAAGDTYVETKITRPSTAATMVFNFSGKDYSYFHLKTPGNAVYMDSIVVNYTSNNGFITQCADNQVRVTYDFNGGTGTACTEGVTTKSASYSVCSTEPTKDYYDFAGWNDGTNTYDAGATYNLQATTEFEAQWTPTVYTISYNLNGGTQQVSPAAPTSYTYESSAVTLPTAPTYGHNRFEGWYGNADLSTGGVQTTIAAGSNGNKTYYAKWETRNEFKFYADDYLLATLYRASDENLEAAASGTLSGQGAKPTDPSAPSACSSKVFMGWTEIWFNDETDTEPGDLSDATGKKTEDKTYYAVWATRSGDVGSYTYSAYSTTCCSKEVTVSGGSPEHGTVTFDKSYAWTCKGDREIVMTIDPADGYQLHTFSVATGGGKVAAKEMSADVALDNNSSAPQEITLTFAKDADGAYDVTATFTEMVVTDWSWTNHDGGAALTTDPIEIYVDQQARVDVVYTPAKADLLSGHTAASYYDQDATGSAYVKNPTKASEYFTFYGKASTGEGTTTITLTHHDDTSSPKSFPQLIYVKVLPLPLVHFVDNVHNESFADVVATIANNALAPNKKTPTHDDLDEPGSGNNCEKTHLHLIGWIRSDYEKVANYMNGTGDAPTVSELESAGTGYWFAPNADINVYTYDGKTFYAVWAVEE